MVATFTRLTAASSVTDYFERDGYYAKNDPRHRQASRWYGAGAEALGLRGTVRPARFTRVIKGHVPGTDLRLGRIRDGEHQHVPGVDVTFSAPKSVSLEALVYARPHMGARIVNAHDRAVEASLDFLERELLQTRAYDPATGRRPRVAANGLVAARFRHDTNRNLDPQLHTHCVIANMTRSAGGEWRSAEFTRTSRARFLLGAFYRAELERNLRGIGYATVPTMYGRMPAFEIAGYSRATVEAFSTRQREARAWLDERGLEHSREKMQQAVLYTRRRKEEPDRAELAAEWQRRAAQPGMERDGDAARGRGRGRERPGPSRAADAPSALALVQGAVEHIEERRVVFSAEDVRARALAASGGRRSLDEIDAAIDRLREDRHLIEAKASRADTAFVTARALVAEREIVAWMREGLGAGRDLAPEAAVEARLAASLLNADQADAVRLLLGTGGGIVGVQGHAGTGKTVMLREAAALAEAHGRPVIGLAPSARAAHILGREADIPSRTLQWMLARYRDAGTGAAGPKRTEAAREALGGALLVVDEASMIGTVQMRSLMRIAHNAGVGRIALVGDRRQLRSVEAGQPFELLQDAGMPTAHMRTLQRQRDPALKAAVMNMIEGRPGLAVAGLGPGVMEAPSDELPRRAAELWLDLDPEARRGTEILTPIHELRAEINREVRRGLAREGTLHGRALEIERCVNLHLTRAEKGDPANWRAGDIAAFTGRDYAAGAERGDHARILGIADGRVRMRTLRDGRVREVDPSGRLRYRVELYATEPIELRAGDRIRWTRNDAGRGLLNGQRAEVVSVGPKRIRLRKHDGEEIAMRHGDAQLRHIDHAWSSTVHAAQGMTCDRVIAVLDSDAGAISDQTMFYVQISRARDGAVVLTDDRAALVKELETRTPEQLSALRAVGESFGPAPDGPGGGPIPAKDAPLPGKSAAADREFEDKAERMHAPRSEERMRPDGPGTGPVPGGDAPRREKGAAEKAGPAKRPEPEPAEIARDAERTEPAGPDPAPWDGGRARPLAPAPRPPERQEPEKEDPERGLDLDLDL